jgi:hypothetical protein
MSELQRKGISHFFRFRHRIRNRMIQDVPEKYQFCVFECHESKCTMGNWDICESRLRYQAQHQKQA